MLFTGANGILLSIKATQAYLRYTLKTPISDISETTRPQAEANKGVSLVNIDLDYYIEHRLV